MTSTLLRTDVLAIRCIEDLVLVGMGPTLYVYKNFELESKLNCLYPNNVHGIVVGSNNKLAIFGAKSICICDITKEPKKIRFKEQSTNQFSDWIIAVEWISVKEQMQLAILFAHNYLSIYDIFDQSSQVVQCKEKCILYGGSIVGTSPENLVIFSGTVFQEVLIWKIDNSYNFNESMPVLHRLTGHKGVIFSVICDPDSRLICSTSDDRSVRFWKVIESENSESNNINWQTAEIVPMKTMFIHTARVWKAIIRNDIVITIGEDSLMCTWSLSGDLLNKVHHRAPIWSIDTSKDNKTIYTGGADGSVHMWPIVCYNSPKIIALPDNDTRNIPRYISYLRSGTILILNEMGTLLCYDKKKMVHMNTVHLAKYYSYCIMKLSPDRSFVALASREGYVTIYKGMNIYRNKNIQQNIKSFFDSNRSLNWYNEGRIMESQIFSLHWLTDIELIACGTNGLLKTFYFVAEDGVHVTSQYTLPPNRECWLTAAVIYNHLLVCGDRAGNIHVFKYGDKNVEKPIQTFSRVHGKIGVQSFSVFKGKLMTTGRDGMLRFYQGSKEDTKPLLMLHRKKMPMDWISGMLRSKYSFLIFGFKEVEFIVYNLSNESVLVRVPCGGGHRSWDCTLLDIKTASFAYIQNKQVYIFDYALPSNNPSLQNGFHIKETCCLQYIRRSGRQDIFISGGEDCTLRISSIHKTEDNSYVFDSLGIFDGHLSGIKCMSLIKLNDKIDESSIKYLVFSGGGRAQLKVWEINLKYETQDTSCDVSCSDIKSHMLYGQDQYRKKPWQEDKQSYVMEPETRYMDIYAYYSPEDVRHVLIFIACADGYLRLLVYNIETNNTYLKVSTKYIDRCILKMYILSHRHKVIVLTMTTDGMLRFFDFTGVVSKIHEDVNSENQDIVDLSDGPFAQFSLHQSGINSFDLKRMDEDRYLLITGGDDNLLNLICFQICISENDNILSAAMLSKWSTASAHSAQITGLRFKNDNEICSVGIDQQVIIYNYSWSNGVISADILYKTLTSVTDVQGMDLWRSENSRSSIVCIYGRGFEVLSI